MSTEWNCAQECKNLARSFKEADEDESLRELLIEVISWYVHYRISGMFTGPAMAAARQEWDV